MPAAPAPGRPASSPGRLPLSRISTFLEAAASLSPASTPMTASPCEHEPRNRSAGRLSRGPSAAALAAAWSPSPAMLATSTSVGRPGSGRGRHRRTFLRPCMRRGRAGGCGIPGVPLCLSPTSRQTCVHADGGVPEWPGAALRLVAPCMHGVWRGLHAQEVKGMSFHAGNRAIRAQDPGGAAAPEPGRGRPRQRRCCPPSAAAGCPHRTAGDHPQLAAARTRCSSSLSVAAGGAAPAPRAVVCRGQAPGRGSGRLTESFSRPGVRQSSQHDQPAASRESTESPGAASGPVLQEQLSPQQQKDWEPSWVGQFREAVSLALDTPLSSARPAAGDAADTSPQPCI